MSDSEHRRRRPDGPDYIMYPFIAEGRGLATCPWEQCSKEFCSRTTFVKHAGYVHGKSHRDIIWRCRKCNGSRHSVEPGNLQSVSRHFNRCPGPIVEPDNASIDPRRKCPECGRTFATFAGCQVHRRRKHPCEFNAELPDPSSRMCWTNDDLRDLAEAEFEIRSRVPKVLTVIKELEKCFQRRMTYNQVSRGRRNPRYREILAQVTAERTGALRPLTSPVTHQGVLEARTVASGSQSGDDDGTRPDPAQETAVKRPFPSSNASNGRVGSRRSGTRTGSRQDTCVMRRGSRSQPGSNSDERESNETRPDVVQETTVKRAFSPDSDDDEEGISETRPGLARETAVKRVFSPESDSDDEVDGGSDRPGAAQETSVKRVLSPDSDRPGRRSGSREVAVVSSPTNPSSSQVRGVPSARTDGNPTEQREGSRSPFLGHGGRRGRRPRSDPLRGTNGQNGRIRTPEGARAITGNDPESSSRRCREAASQLHQAIIRDGPGAMNVAFDRFCDVAGLRVRRRKHRGDTKRAEVPKNRNQRKLERFKQHQLLFKTDKKRLLKLCADGGRSTGDSVSKLPLKVDIERVYTERFGSESPPDDAPTRPKTGCTELALNPFSDAEILAGFGTLSWDSAPGVDKDVTTKFLKVTLSHVGTRDVMNSFLLARRIPDRLRENRTVLIPKKEGATSVNEFRPITMGSLFLRFYAKLLASRVTRATNLDIRQKAFLPVDGCSENLWLLDEAIHQARKGPKELNIVTLDVAKAFDMVSHNSILRAIRRFGLGDGFEAIVGDMYQNIRTRITGGDGETGDISMSRGVKQGCPLSPILFNMVTDELLCSVGTRHGIALSDQRDEQGQQPSVNMLAFADDLVLMSRSMNGMDQLLKATEVFFEARSMTVNASKSHAIRMAPARHKKCIKVIDGSTFTYRGEQIPNSSVTEVVKYLGIEMTSLGSPKVTMDRLSAILRGLPRIALKPQQKIEMLRAYVLPCMGHELRLSRLDAGTLRGMSRLIRRTARDILHLPPGTPREYFHMSEKQGGLHLPELERSVPVTRVCRITSLRGSTDPAVRITATESGRLERELLMWQRTLDTRLCERRELTKLKRDKQEQVCERFRATTTGRLFKDAGKSTHKHEWLKRGGALSGRQYVTAVHALFEQLETRVNRHRGVEGPAPVCRRCRRTAETQMHALCECQSVKEAVMRRHNWCAARITTELTKRGATVLSEHTFWHRGRVFKPDLVVVHEDEVFVVDIAVPYDNTSERLITRHKEKVEKYRVILPSVKSKLSKSRGEVLAVVLGARGLTLTETTDKPLKRLGIYTKSLVRELAVGALRGSTFVWDMFNRQRG